AGVTAVPVGAWNSLLRTASPLIPQLRDLGIPGDKLHKGAGLFSAESGADLYRRMISQWQAADVMEGVHEVAEFGPPREGRWPTLTEQMMLEDACHYMPDDNLVKVDRAAMACS